MIPTQTPRPAPVVPGLPGRPPPNSPPRSRPAVSSRLRSQRTTSLVSPGPGTERRGMRHRPSRASLPPLIARPAVDGRIRGTSAVRPARSRGCRGVDERGVFRVGGQAPHVVKIHPPVRALPTVAEVRAPGRTRRPRPRTGAQGLRGGRTGSGSRAGRLASGPARSRRRRRSSPPRQALCRPRRGSGLNRRARSRGRGRSRDGVGSSRWARREDSSCPPARARMSPPSRLTNRAEGSVPRRRPRR